MLILAGANDGWICCSVVGVSMLIGAIAANRWSHAAKEKIVLRERTAKVNERARYNRIKVSEGQARGLAMALCELCGGTGTYEGDVEATQDCPRCLGLGVVTQTQAAINRCPRCRQPVEDRTAAFCPNCGLELPD